MHTKDGLRITTVNTAVVAASDWAKATDRVIVLHVDTGNPATNEGGTVDGDGTWGEALHLN